MREEARDLTAVEGMNADRIAGLKRYTDEFLEEGVGAVHHLVRAALRRLLLSLSMKAWNV
jgi:hypothetical protein